MSDFNSSIFDILQSIEGSGSFLTSKRVKYPYIGLQIEGFGEVGLPIHPDMAEDLIQKKGIQAPYGKGGETLVDTAVRNTFEVDAAEISFNGPEWDKFLKKILHKVKKGLGLEEKSIQVHLYKLLIYRTGGFFLPHRDTEKEKGMFGTLILTLPSPHSGGDLVVSFGENEERVDFSKAKMHKIGFAAFFADCEHEIKTIRSGYRVSLVFNLVQVDQKKAIESPVYSDDIQKLAECLRAHKGEFDYHPKAIVLDHQYTPANFHGNSLKGNDDARAWALVQAAEIAGYYASFGLVTLHYSGTPDFDDLPSKGGRSRRGYDEMYYHDDSDFENCGMDEIHETNLDIDHWGGGAAPGLGGLSFEEADILASFELGEEGNPIEKSAEGFMGNYGPSLDHWYHYGAVVIWPKDQHIDILESLSPKTKTDWLSYYVEKWDKPNENYPEQARNIFEQIMTIWTQEEKPKFESSLTPIVQYLKQANDAELVKLAQPILATKFHNLEATQWEDLLETFGPSAFDSVFSTVENAGKLSQIFLQLKVLRLISTNPQPKYQDWIRVRLLHLPKSLENAKITTRETSHFSRESKKPNNAVEIITELLSMDFPPYCDGDWYASITEALTKDMDRKYVYDTLKVVIQPKKVGDTRLYSLLKAKVIDFLKEKTAIKPKFPDDWSKPIPNGNQYKKIWNILAEFLQSPTMRVFEYRMAQAARTEMEYAIRSTDIELDMNTLRKGSPHTLALTKNMNHYERDLNYWKTDLEFLADLES